MQDNAPALVLTRACEKPHAAKWDIMQVPGGSSADLYVGTGALHLPAGRRSHSLAYILSSQNGTIAADWGRPGLFVMAARRSQRVDRRSKRYLGLFVLSGGRVEQFRHVVLHLH